MIELKKPGQSGPGKKVREVYAYEALAPLRRSTYALTLWAGLSNNQRYNGKTPMQ
jgi:hypothetical protein